MQHASMYLQQIWYSSCLDDNDAFASAVHMCRTDRYHSSWRNWKNIPLQNLDHARQISISNCIAVLWLLWDCYKAMGKLTCGYCVAFILFLHIVLEFYSYSYGVAKTNTCAQRRPKIRSKATHFLFARQKDQKQNQAIPSQTHMKLEEKPQK